MAGQNGTPIIGMKPKPVQFTWTEEMYRDIARQITRDVGNQGGGMPMPDPAGFLAIRLVLDKLEEILMRLKVLEAVYAVPKDVGEQMKNENQDQPVR